MILGNETVSGGPTPVFTNMGVDTMSFFIRDIKDSESNDGSAKGAGQ